MASPESALQDLLLQKTRTRFPAVSLAIGKGSQIIWHEAAGYADVENGTRNTPETLFGIGSITKVFIAVLALQLNEEGLLPLDAPVSRWLDEKLYPELPMPIPPPPDNFCPITLLSQAGKMIPAGFPMRAESI
uniref:serine hydrolase domain-containing protein n=2 Tax=Erwiniaceae TaxID=1903409 RepID=UPI0013152EF5